MTSKGVEIRAQIDTETVKGLLLLNGGGAVALLAFLPATFSRPGLEPLTTAVVWALPSYLLGLAMAVAHNRFRRVCSNIYENHSYNPPRCRFLPRWIKQNHPCVCAASVLLMWLSLLSFVSGGGLVFAGGIKAIGRPAPSQETACWKLEQIDKRAYKVNRCTGTVEIIDLPTPPKKDAKR